MVTVMDLMFGLQNLRGYTVDYSALSIYIYLYLSIYQMLFNSGCGYLGRVIPLICNLSRIVQHSTLSINIQISRLSRTSVE